MTSLGGPRALVALALAACGPAPFAPADASTDAPFATAPHDPLPRVPDRGGPTLARVGLVVVTFADDASRARIESFARWIGGSRWLSAVGADYGVEGGTVLATVERADAAPDAVGSTEIAAMLSAGVADGSLPAPTTGALYMVFYPAHTTVRLDVGADQPPAVGCRDFQGFHDEFRAGASLVPYAVVPDCGGAADPDALTVTASHEYVEAATDPLPLSRPAFQLVDDGSSAWARVAGEVADLCDLSRGIAVEDGWSVQRVWSNAAASSGGDPCVPSDPSRTYFNAAVAPADVQSARAGDAVSFALTGWSTAPVGDWSVSVARVASTADLRASLSASALNNARGAVLTVSVPADAPSGSWAAFVVTSGDGAARSARPVAVTVE